MRVCACALLFWVSWLDAPLSAQPAVISAVEFRGNQSLQASRLKAGLKMSREGRVFSPDALEFELQEVERIYQDNGFLKVRVGPPVVQFSAAEGGSRSVAIQVPVAEGPVYTAGRIEIREARLLNAATLLQMAPLRAGQPYRRRLVDEWLDRIRSTYNEMGYIRFEADRREEIHEAEHSVDCVLEFREGGEYRVSEIQVASNEVDVADLRKHLIVSEGAVYNPDMLGASIQFLNLRRIYRPFGPDDVEVRIDDGAKTVVLIFHIVPLKKSDARGGGRSLQK